MSKKIVKFVEKDEDYIGGEKESVTINGHSGTIVGELEESFIVMIEVPFGKTPFSELFGEYLLEEDMFIKESRVNILIRYKDVSSCLVPIKNSFGEKFIGIIKGREREGQCYCINQQREDLLLLNTQVKIRTIPHPVYEEAITYVFYKDSRILIDTTASPYAGCINIMIPKKMFA